MINPMYGYRSSPTKKQIAEGIVKHGGYCYKVIGWCISRKISPISDRDGDCCPQWSPGRHCLLTVNQRVECLRKWLMENP